MCCWIAVLLQSFEKVIKKFNVLKHIYCHEGVREIEERKRKTDRLSLCFVSSSSFFFCFSSILSFQPPSLSLSLSFSLSCSSFLLSFSLFTSSFFLLHSSYFPSFFLSLF